MSLSAPGMTEGISCVACHTISAVDQRGNADYVLTPPEKYLWENREGALKWVSDFLIRAYPLQHLADYDRNLLRTPEYCAACHKQFIPEALNRFGNWSRARTSTTSGRTVTGTATTPRLDLSLHATVTCGWWLRVDAILPAATGRPVTGVAAEDDRVSSPSRLHRHQQLHACRAIKLPGWQHHVAAHRRVGAGRDRAARVGRCLAFEGPVAGLDFDRASGDCGPG